jgi:uncharacterized Zn-binding protein involved in type VI secretion
MPPAARVTDMHVCPMVTPGVPPIPHVGGPILPPGAPTVLIDFLPAATVTDMATCVGPPDMIAMGSTGVFINFLPAARLGDPTVHGGVITLGSPTCIIGEVGSPSPGEAGLWGVVAGMAATTKSSPDNPSILGVGIAKAQTSAVPIVTEPKPIPPPLPGSAPNMVPPAGTYSRSKSTESEIVCGLKVNSASITCQHGRPHKDGLLEVVGSLAGDTIDCKSQAIGGCGKHPLWEIGGYWIAEKVGANTSFKARNFQALLKHVPLLPVWLGDIEPHVYEVSVASCSGPSYSFDVNAYPNDPQELEISGTIYEKSFKPVLEALEDVLKQLLGTKPTIDFLEGSGKCSLQWKEDKDSNLAYYCWSISLGFSPLVGIKFRFPLGPSAIPPVLSHFGNAGFFLEADGDVTIGIEGAQVDPPDFGKGHFDVKSESSLTLAIGGSVYIGDEDDPLISAEVAVQSEVKLELTGTLEDHRPVVHGEIMLGSLKGCCVFQYLWWPKSYECTFIPERTVWEDDFHPFASRDEAAEGAE